MSDLKLIFDAIHPLFEQKEIYDTCRLRTDVADWCTQNNVLVHTDYEWLWLMDNRGALALRSAVYFQTDADLMHFKLTWC